MLWLLCGVYHTASMAYAYDRTSPSASWGYQQLSSVRVYPNHAVSYGAMNRNNAAGGGYYSPAPNHGLASQLSYQFHTTSVYINSSNFESQRIMMGTEMRRTEGWTDQDDDEPSIGTVTPTPLGEPLVLLLFAMLYVCCRVRKKLKNA